MSKQFKGTLVADEGANREYVKIAQEEGWKIIVIPPSQRNIGMSDVAVVAKYTKNIHPIFTSDKTSYKHYAFTNKDLGRSGFIIHKFIKPSEADRYGDQIRRFFSDYTEKHTHGVVWTIEVKSKATKMKIVKERN